MLTTIKLNGALGKEFLPELQADVHTVRETINFLCCYFENFKHYVLGTDWVYSIIIKAPNWEREVDENSPELLLPITGLTVEITPAIQGSGEVGKFITSVAMIGIGIALTTITGVGAIGVNLGWGLIISGATGLLQSVLFGNPSTHMNNDPSEISMDDRRSSFFQSPGYMTKEGTPIPLVFGEVLVKNFQVLSVEITSSYSA
jgi:predicted phage tail protein